MGLPTMLGAGRGASVAVLAGMDQNVEESLAVGQGLELLCFGGRDAQCGVETLGLPREDSSTRLRCYNPMLLSVDEEGRDALP